MPNEITGFEIANDIYKVDYANLENKPTFTGFLKEEDGEVDVDANYLFEHVTTQDCGIEWDGDFLYVSDDVRCDVSNEGSGLWRPSGDGHVAVDYGTVAQEIAGNGLGIDSDGMLSIVTQDIAGSGIYSEDGLLNMDYSSIAGNIVGIGLYSDDGTLNMDASSLAGSGLYSDNGTLAVDTSSLAGNCLSDDEGRLAVDTSLLASYLGGGGLYSGDGMLSVDTSSFAGSGIYVEDGGSLSVDLSYVANGLTEGQSIIATDGNGHLYIDIDALKSELGIS